MVTLVNTVQDMRNTPEVQEQIDYIIRTMRETLTHTQFENVGPHTQYQSDDRSIVPIDSFFIYNLISHPMSLIPNLSSVKPEEFWYLAPQYDMLIVFDHVIGLYRFWIEAPPSWKDQKVYQADASKSSLEDTLTFTCRLTDGNVREDWMTDTFTHLQDFLMWLRNIREKYTEVRLEPNKNRWIKFLASYGVSTSPVYKEARLIRSDILGEEVKVYVKEVLRRRR